MTAAQFAHAAVFPPGTKVNGRGHLEVGGCDTVELAERFGTPLYVYNEQTIREMCREFRDEFEKLYPDSRIVYAGKAYLGIALLRLLRDEGLGLDVVSGGELAIAHAAQKARDFEHQGDTKQAETWRRIEAALRQMQGPRVS